MLQMKHTEESPTVLVPGTIEALEQLEAAGHLASEIAAFLRESYRFLRSVEARLRLMNTTARHDLPEDPHELDKLAFLFGATSGHALEQQCRNYGQENRACFGRIFKAAGEKKPRKRNSTK